MVGILLVGFVWLNLQISVSWQVYFQWGSCGSIFSFLCHGWQTFSGVRLAQSLVFCVMVGRLLVGFVWLNLQFSVSWLVDFQWCSCGSIFRFLCHGWQTFSGVREAQSLVFCVMVGRILMGFVWLNLQFSVSWLVDFQWGSCGSIFSFLCHGWQTFSGVSVAQSLVFCVMVGRLLVGFVWLNLQFSVTWLVDFQWASCGSIFRFLCHGRYTFSGVRVAQSFVFCVMFFQGGSCVMVGRLLVGFVWLNLQFSVSWLVDWLVIFFQCHGVDFQFVWLNLQFSVSWLVDFQWGSCGSIFNFLCHGRQTFSGVRVAQIFSFLCHGRQTFSGVRVAQSLAFCVMVGKFLVVFVWLNLQFFVSWQVDFQWAVCLNLLFSVSWLVDFQWGSCGSNFSFLCHGWQTFSGVRVAQSLVFCVMVVDFQWVRVAQTLVFCVMVGRLLGGFVWLNLQFSVSWLVSFSGLRVAQSLVFCVMVGRLLVGFVWLNLQFSVSWSVDFQWGSCGSIFSFLCHGRQTFSGVRVAQSFVFCVIVGRLLMGFVWLNLYFLCHGWYLLVGSVQLNLQFSVSWLVDFQGGSCGSIFSFLCHGWQTFSGVRVAQSLVFCDLVGRLLVGLVWLNLLISVSWQVYF